MISFRAEGHENVLGTHESTFEVTTDGYLTPAGDCIIGINAEIAPCDVPDDFVARCQHHDRLIRARLSVGSYESVITGSGHPELTFASDRSFVFRTSSYVDDRTVMVSADKAAVDIDRELIQLLSNGKPVAVEIRVSVDE